MRNTLINVFNNYVAIRRKIKVPLEAYKKLGKYGGDDGITMDVSSEHLEHAFASMGMLIKGERKKRGEPVGFLGRVYLDPWVSPSSIIDVKRQVSKLHATVQSVDVPDDLILNRKASGYVVTDKQTPVVGAWAVKVLELTANWKDVTTNYEQQMLKDVYYYSRVEPEGGVVFPKLSAGEEQLAYDFVAAELGTTSAEIHEFETKLKGVTKWTELEQFGGYFGGSLALDGTGYFMDGELYIDGVPIVVEQQNAVTYNAEHQVKVAGNKTRDNFPTIKKRVRLSVNPQAPDSAASRKEKLSHDPVYKNVVKINKPCKQFVEQGKCTYGKKCKFRHQ